MMEYLIAVDLEGVHGVVGERYKGLSKSLEMPEYYKAVEAASLEVDAAAKALFEAGATKVAVWDNHAGGNNLDFSKLDPRIKPIFGNGEYRMDFAREHNFSGIVFIGYHAKEGTLGGVLAHTFSSVSIQYIKINGVAVGELEVDTYIAGTYGIAPIFAASDRAGVLQMQQICNATVTVITKDGKGRNAAILRGREEVLNEIYEGAKSAVKSKAKPLTLPMPATVEIRYTRMERAEEIYAKMKNTNEIDVVYGEDAHVLTFKIRRVDQIPQFI